MNIQIIGCGMVGSSIANELLNLDGISSIRLVDIDRHRARGEFLDLERVRVIKGPVVKISYSDHPNTRDTDLSIISLGQRCDYGIFPSKDEAIHDLLRKNWPEVYKVACHIRTGAIMVVTNPADLLAARLRSRFPRREIIHAGHLVDLIQDGRTIQSLKGYTNWGIAAEVGIMIKSKRR